MVTRPERLAKQVAIEQWLAQANSLLALVEPHLEQSLVAEVKAIEPILPTQSKQFDPQ